MTLSAEKILPLRNGQLRRIDLSSRVPSRDPAGFFFRLFAEFPGAELCGVFAGDIDDLKELSWQAAGNGIRFVLLQVDSQLDLDWLVPPTVTQCCIAPGVRIMPFSQAGLDSAGCSLHATRAEALEACINEWQRQLLEHFNW